jgi:hypothetical protein
LLAGGNRRLERSSILPYGREATASAGRDAAFASSSGRRPRISRVRGWKRVRLAAWFDLKGQRRARSSSPRAIFFRLVLRAAAALGAAAFVETPAPAAAAPVRIVQCFVVPRLLSQKAGGTQIDYINTTNRFITSVTFAVVYRNALHTYTRRVTDIGSFAPDAEIRHKFSLYSDVTYAGKQTRGCAPISVVFEDGTHWR